ncbi:MAG: ROK family protein [Abitibacteriaceae bacterium]|nr:ROK family protein [Abditibacteriaceae bacterium]MBV9867724.1 ROK family protein [Abditibacteriaceae bacterium]
MHILCIDIGGTGLKAAVVDAGGKLLTERVRVKTPQPCKPEVVVEALVELVKPLPTYQCVSVGFPGVVRDGKVYTAPMLGNELWRGILLADQLAEELQKPVRLVNDADMQGLAAIEGKGMEMVITLGTGFGSAIFRDGRLGPHLELSMHPLAKNKTYNERLGNAALKKVGKQKWNRRVRHAIDVLRVLTNFDQLYIGGGNAEKINFELDADIQVISNLDGLRGGAWLWKDDAEGHVQRKTQPTKTRHSMNLKIA